MFVEWFCFAFSLLASMRSDYSLLSSVGRNVGFYQNFKNSLSLAFMRHSQNSPKRLRGFPAFSALIQFFFPPTLAQNHFFILIRPKWILCGYYWRAKKCPYRFLRSWWDVGVIARTARSSFSYMSWKIQSWVGKLGFSDLTELSFFFKKQVIIHLQTHLSLLCCQ